MTQERTYIDYLEDILGATKKVAQFIGQMDYEQFVNDEKTFFAVIRAMEIIGEATKQLPSSFRDNHPEISWRVMAGMRDKLIHHYFGVDEATIWETATQDLPQLSQIVQKILGK